MNTIVIKHRTKLIGTMLSVLTFLVCIAGNPNAHAQDASPATDPGFEATMKLFGKMVGGTWATTGAFKAELKYEWRVPGKAIRGTGRAAIDTPQEFPMESLYGWDASAKKVYYLDFHGHDTIYKGLVAASGNVLNGEFEGMTGDNGKYRFSDELKEDGTLVTTMFGKNKEGKWVSLHSMSWKRKP